MSKMKKRIGVYVCHCGGNISDYIDVEQLGKLMAKEEGVVISKDVMFACSDSTQKEMVEDIQKNKLDSIVVASCSPKLHLHTFRGVAIRAGINPYCYTQVNIREQCSWAHSDKPMEATIKAYGLIRAGINRVSHAETLEGIEIKAHQAVAVIGAGVAGLRASIELARMGNQVFLIEKEKTVGGNVLDAGKLFVSNIDGKELIGQLTQQIKELQNINIYTNALLEKISGSVGNFSIEININGEIINHAVGSVLVTTGFDFYTPTQGEYGYSLSNNVMTLNDFNRLIQNSDSTLKHNGKTIKTVAYIYCVGNRQSKGENKYCSRQCCTAAIHSSLKVHEKFNNIKAFHIYRDIRTYGKQELLYQESSKKGDIYIRFEEKEPPIVELESGNPVIKVKDYLTSKKELTLDADIIVLVTGMIPRVDSNDVSSKLKIPIGNDKFFNEIHPKLKPVETVIKGIYIGGACQGPKNITESVQSALSAAAKINAVSRKGTIDLEPIVARIDPNTCAWCNKCLEVCEYDAIRPLEISGKMIAEVNTSTCTGCGICAPVCPVNAIDIALYTDNEIESMIDGFAEPANIAKRTNIKESNSTGKGRNLAGYPKLWRNIAKSLYDKNLTIPQISSEIGINSHETTYNVMSMNRYGFIESVGLDEEEVYHIYQLKK